MEKLRDEFGRTFKTLRVSLINSCNLSCVYCTCGKDELKENQTLTREQGLSVSQLNAIIHRLHQKLQFETIRFTGGEPLLYSDLTSVISAAKELGIKIKLTTNGLLLENKVADLKQAGLSAVNVSLDAIDEDVFYKISRRSGLNRIISGIDKAISCGMEVKINAVIMKNLNENQLLPLLDFAFDRNIKIRFLEIMAMGHLFGKADEHFFSQEEMLEIIEKIYSLERLPRKPSSTANYWKTKEDNVFGIVANETEPFCSDCDRLRLDSLGNIYGCLSSNYPLSVNEHLTDRQLMERLESALAQKQSVKFTGSNLSMLNIGG